MNNSKQPLMLTLPDSLRAKFAALEARLWRCDTALLAGRMAGAVAASFVGVWLCDRLGDTPTWLRTGWVVAGLSGCAAAGWHWFRQWSGRRSDVRRLSRIVQKRHRALGDTLLGIVELADEKTRPAEFSPELYSAAIEQVAERAGKLDFSLAANPGPAICHAWIAAGFGGMILVFVLVSPPVAWNAALRWLQPVAGIPRLTLVDWEQLPREKVVAHGEAFELGGRVVFRSFWKPSDGKLSIDSGRPISFELKSGNMRVELPGLVKEGAIRFKIGDATREVAIHPTHRPALKKLEASVKLPDYLEYGPTNLAVQGGVLGVLEGSSLKVVGEATRKLDQVSVTSQGTAPADWKVNSSGFESPEFQAGNGENFSISWRDNLGLSNAPAWQLSLQVEKDLAPSVEMPDLSRDVAILESEVLEVKVLARDDFGVKELGLAWESSDAALAEGGNTNRAAVKAGFRHRARTTHEARLQESFSFSPGLHGFKADSSLELQAQAVDFKPGREPVVSTLYRVHVLGAERHAEMIRQRLEALLSRLEEVTRAEERVNAATKELQQAENLAEEAAAAKAGELAEEQKQNAELLNQLAQEGLRTLREAARNPALNDQTLKQWAKHLQSMKDVSAKSMAQAGKSLQSAKQSPKDKKEKLSEAKEKEEEAIESLEQLQKDVNAGLDDLQALTLAQRLRKISEGQEEIQGRIQKVIGDTIGLLPSELADRHKRLHKALSDEQGGLEDESKKVEGEISRFFERTRRGEYGQVSQEMRSARTVDELEKIRGLITDNIGMEAMNQLGLWTERFKGWAQALEPKPKQSSSSSSNGQQKVDGEDAEKLMEILLGLLRTREAQASVRERTRMLDQQGKAAEGYEESARRLAGSQQKLIFRMDQMLEENPVKALAPVLQSAFLSMRSTENLLSKPQTDQATLSAEARSLEMLTDAINLINEQTERGGQSQSKSSSPSAEEMAFLMQMMQQQNQGMSPMNGSGNGSESGGGTGSGALQAGGNADGKGGAGRAVSRGSGVGGALPAEFREALENYFQQLESQQK